MSLRQSVRVACLALVLGGWAGSAGAAQQFDPVYRFRTLATAHFRIHFHQGEDRLAARLAVIAEDAWRALTGPIGTTPPPPRTEVVLVDQTDLSNGYAYALPRDTIVIFTVRPPGSELGKIDDWLKLVFTHEFTHIVHLDRSEGWARLVRRVFGRVELAFPNTMLPLWQIEGLATYEESVITGQGRLHSGDFGAIVAEAARTRTLAPLDRVNGGLTAWPGGLAQYAYGVSFHAYLADRYGVQKLATLADRTARSLPFLSSRAFRNVYGKSLGTLWREYEASLVRSHPVGPAAPADSETLRVEQAQRLTTHGFIVSGPRFAPPVCASCAAEVVYSTRDPHEFPALYQLRLDLPLDLPLDGSAPRRLATRVLGSTTGPGRETIYFDQQEVRRNTGVYSDLYALDRASGKVRRITTDARVEDPDLSPDGRTIVAVQNRPGQRDLVTIPVGPGAGTASPTVTLTSIVAEPDTNFNAPRWSPDGRSIVVERQRLGGQPEIVIVDAAEKTLRVIASDPGTRWVTPTWRPDGRAIIAAADFDEAPFNLYEVDLERGRARQLTHATGGATWPEVSPDGQTIIYVGYTIAGYDLFRVPYAGAAAGADTTSRAEPHANAAAPTPPVPPAAPAKPYSPWATLGPTWWSPVVETPSGQIRAGAATGGFDALGYHGYAASATWSFSRPADAPAIDSASPDWTMYYVYARWQPSLWVSASRETSFFGGAPTDAGVPSTAVVRARKIEVGVQLPVRHVRVSQAALISFVRGVDDFTFLTGTVSRDRAAVRAAWRITSAHRYGYSISPEGGATLGFTAEAVRRALGSSADATAFSGDARAYLPGFAAHHVLAVRLSGGASSGDRNLGRTFLVGGPGPNATVTGFGSETMTVLRGFSAHTFAGTHVALVNMDYRFPLARPERGVGTWPLFLRAIHAAVFADAGHAWTRAFATRDLKTSFGAELSFDVVARYWLPMTATVGAAYGRDGSRVVTNGGLFYARIGHAF